MDFKIIRIIIRIMKKILLLLDDDEIPTHTKKKKTVFLRPWRCVCVHRD